MRVSEAFFSALDIDFDEDIERREDFDETIDRETISAQNIDFFDVAADNASNNIDSLVDEDVAEDVDIVITAFDVDSAIVVIVTNSTFDDVLDDVSINVDLLDDRDFVFCTMTTKMFISSNLLSSRT